MKRALPAIATTFPDAARRSVLLMTGVVGLEEHATIATCYSLPAGARLIAAGDVRRYGAVVVSQGELQVVIESTDGEGAVTLRRLRPGEIFDDSTLASVGRHRVSLCAAVDAAVICIPDLAWQRTLTRSNDAMMAWLRETTLRLEEIQGHLDDLLFGSVERRMLRELRRIGQESGRLLDNGNVEVIRPPDADTARTVGSRRETICRVRAGLVKRGLLVERGRQVLELTPAAMNDEVTQ